MNKIARGNSLVVRMGGILCGFLVSVAAATFGEMTISQNLTLTEDTDWRDQGKVTIEAGVTVDLNGHNLVVKDLGGAGRIENGPRFRYFRYKVDAVQNGGSEVQVGQFQLFCDYRDVTSAHTAVIYDPNPSFLQQVPEKCLNNNFNDKWFDNRGSSYHYFILDYGAPVLVTRYAWYTGDDSWGINGQWGYPHRTPKDWRLQGSNDEGDEKNWTDIDVVVAWKDTTASNYALAWDKTLVQDWPKASLVFEAADGESVDVSVGIVGAITIVKRGAGTVLMPDMDIAYVTRVEIDGGLIRVKNTGSGIHSSFSGEICVAAGAQLDVNTPQPGSQCMYEATHGKVVQIAGDGPDGKGILYNSGESGSTYFGPHFGRLELTADASIGGASRMDIRPLGSETVANCRIEGDHTLTVKDMGGGIFGTLDVTWNLDRLRVEGQMSFERQQQGTITNGVWLADGAWVMTYSGTAIGAEIPFVVEENAVAAIVAEDMSATVNSAFTVSPGATLVVTNVQDLVFAGAFTNVGAVVQTGDHTLYLNGPLVGNGSFAGGKVRFGGTESRWVMTANAEGFTNKADFSGVTDAECLCGLKAIDIIYTGDSFEDGKVFALASAGNISAQEMYEIALTVMDAEGNELTGSNYLAIEGGMLYVHLGDDSFPYTAVWTGAAGDGNGQNPANWACTNKMGSAVEGAVPMLYTNVRLDGEATFNCPVGTAFICDTFAANLALGATCDWRGLDLTRIVDGSVIDLKGHDLTVQLKTTPSKAVIFTDSTADAASAGTLHIEVASGMTLTAGTYTFAGTVKLAKEGAGTIEFPNGTPYVSEGGLLCTAGSMKFTGETALGAGKGELTTPTMSTVVDLNGQIVAVKTVNDVGAVVNNSAATATLVFGRGDTDATLGLVMPANTRFRKEGAGTLTVNGTLGTDLDLAGGTVHLQKPAFRHYRFVVLRAWGGQCNSMQFSEFKLLDGETDVTQRRSGFSYTGSAPNQFLDGERPENVLDGSLTTKYLDFRCANGSYAANKGEVYIQFDYAEPQPITAYNWATAGDCPNDSSNDGGRDLRDWVLLASNDGTDWVTLDKRTGYYATTARHTWVGPFVVGATASSVNVTGSSAGGALVVDDVNLAMKSLIAVDELAFANGGTLSVVDGSVQAGMMTGAGKIVKTGTGAVALQGSYALEEGGIQVDGGRVSLLPQLLKCKWFRFSIQQIEGGDTMQISELALYDVNGNRVNQGLGKGSSAASLTPGSSYASPGGNNNESWEKIFDNNTGTKWCVGGVGSSPSTPSSWLVVTMRLADTAATVARYNFATANDSGSYTGRNPKVWRLEASVDGENWMVVDEKAIDQGPHANTTWYNGGTPYSFFVPAKAATVTGRETLGTVGVVADAALIVVDSVAASGLRADWTANGAIVGLQLISNGTLELVNVPANPPSEFIVPFPEGSTFSGSVKNWRVMMNGEEHTELMVSLVNGNICVRRKGLTVFIR